jgi:hypothetical protein
MISFVGGDSPAFFDIRGQITKGTGNVIIVPPLALRIGRQNLKKETETSLTVSNNDGTISDWTLGMDYYIFACRPNEGAEPTLLLSVNSTYPNGYSANNSRKIGGFHYGIVRTGPNPGDVTEGIVPNSVWDLKNRPRCSPEGMVKVGNIWVDIYLASDDGQGGIKSAYNATPLTGTEGLNWYDFVDRAAKVGKRLMTYAEWCAATQGSPQGLDDSNENAWTKTTNTDRNPTGLIPNATSIYNVRDCVGNVYEWLDEITYRATGSTAFTWHNVMPGEGYGQMHMQNEYSLIVLRAGGYWSSGVNAGSRTVNLSSSPWNVNSYYGARAACDAL